MLGFGGNTLWDNSINIKGLMVNTKTINDKINVGMSDRFTGKEGRALQSRLVIVETGLAIFSKEEQDSHAMLDKHMSLSKMRHKNIQARFQKLEAK